MSARGPYSPVGTDTTFESLEIILIYSYLQDNKIRVLYVIGISEYQMLEYEYQSDYQ